MPTTASAALARGLWRRCAPPADHPHKRPPFLLLLCGNPADAGMSVARFSSTELAAACETDARSAAKASP